MTPIISQSRLDQNYALLLDVVMPAILKDIDTLLSNTDIFFKYLPISNFIILPIQIIVGLALGFILCETMQQEEYVEIKSIVINEYKSRKNKQ